MHFFRPEDDVPSSVAVLNDLFIGRGDANATGTQGCMG